MKKGLRKPEIVIPLLISVGSTKIKSSIIIGTNRQRTRILTTMPPMTARCKLDVKQRIFSRRKQSPKASLRSLWILWTSTVIFKNLVLKNQMLTLLKGLILRKRTGVKYWSKRFKRSKTLWIRGFSNACQMSNITMTPASASHQSMLSREAPKQAKYLPLVTTVISNKIHTNLQLRPVWATTRSLISKQKEGSITISSEGVLSHQLKMAENSMPTYSV